MLIKKPIFAAMFILSRLGEIRQQVQPWPRIAPIAMVKMAKVMKTVRRLPVWMKLI